MPPKKGKKGAAVKQEEEEVVTHPLPPNVFLYIQLFNIANLPQTKHQLEIHLSQGDSLIVKCDEHYNTDGIIIQDEFYSRPTFTLIFQQDNVDRINQAADNPLLIKLYLRIFPPQPKMKFDFEFEDEEEGQVEAESDSELGISTGVSFATDDVYAAIETERLELLCVGYLDVIKLFGHRRSIIREQLFLYPMPDVAQSLRSTVHTEWHLYTLLPIAKKLTFTNMAFVTFESIYNLKDEYNLDLDSLWVRLSFRSRVPSDRNDYKFIPLCEFNNFERRIISSQNCHLVFESFRRSVYPWNVTGLKSAMEVQMHQLFAELYCSEGMTVDFKEIEQMEDEALVCNSFHRFILTKKMADILSFAITCQQYVFAVEAFQIVGTAKPQKVFQGVMDPSILVFPGIQNMRFAVQLDYLGKIKAKKASSVMSTSGDRNRLMPTFAIIKICLLSPIGEIYQELKVFRDSFVRQNRLLFCDHPYVPNKVMTLAEIQMESYARFDKFIRECIAFILDKKVLRIEDRKQHFCCAVQNLTNILMKLVGSVFNTKTPTNTSVDFANLCAIAYNDLEPRIHSIVEQIENEGFENFTLNKQIQIERIIDYLNTIKLLYLVNDDRLANLLLERVYSEYPGDERLWFYTLIMYMERGDLEKAKLYFHKNHLADTHDYFAGWIKLYINYVDTRNNPETSADCTECLLKSITSYAEKSPHQQDGWILLYCYYKKFKYEPGCAFAHWRIVEQFGGQGRARSSKDPYSFWNLLIKVNPTLRTSRGNLFFEVFKTFVRLGIYEFAEVVFATIEHLIDEADRYMIRTQLSLMLNQLDDDFVLQSFEFGEDEVAEQLAAMNAQVNGNVEFQRGNFEEAALYYECCLTLPNLEDFERSGFEVSRLRLGYISYEMGNFEKSIEALNFPFSGHLLPVVADYMVGKSYYKLDHLESALPYFARTTKTDTHVPNVWGFLALINLRLGQNYNAVECWKYAKIEPTVSIDDMMIYEELDALDYDSVELYIDIPGQLSEDIFDDSQSTT
ncbi:uncharacterized protein LOC108101333 [Drosophila ficusphila]|uniref:uncharacterized protein LOC108101333 n=1 Tax=Drosophila ficusphila TaxID=30025 RepID=UPI0007E7A0CD|nr:uncharacterized protein LOC108101333 [Drosophila ficusphila]